jgi:nitrite reductase/ring-hydroxylating ferredoxin subunit
VYRNQIGIDRRYANSKSVLEREVAEHNQPLANVAEIGLGQMMLAKVGHNSERIAIGKCADGLHAVQDRCTHKGGPLSDGALIDCKVQCPWHGSQFDITTGRVVAGPAERKIEVVEIEERKGEIYLAPKRPDVKKAA